MGPRSFSSFRFLAGGMGMPILGLSHHCVSEALNLSTFTGSQQERNFSLETIIPWISLVFHLGGLMWLQPWSWCWNALRCLQCWDVLKRLCVWEGHGFGHGLEARNGVNCILSLLLIYIFLRPLKLSVFPWFYLGCGYPPWKNVYLNILPIFNLGSLLICFFVKDFLIWLEFLYHMNAFQLFFHSVGYLLIFLDGTPWTQSFKFKLNLFCLLFLLSFVLLLLYLRNCCLTENHKVYSCVVIWRFIRFSPYVSIMWS